MSDAGKGAALLNSTFFSSWAMVHPRRRLAMAGAEPAEGVGSELGGPGVTGQLPGVDRSSLRRCVDIGVDSSRLIAAAADISFFSCGLVAMSVLPVLPPAVLDVATPWRRRRMRERWRGMVAAAVVVSCVVVGLVVAVVFRRVALRVMMVAFIIFWVRFTYPRFREDQLQSLAWKVLIPLALVNIVVTAALKVVL